MECWFMFFFPSWEQYMFEAVAATIPTNSYHTVPIITIHTLWGIENSARFRSVSTGEETYRCWTSYKTSDRLPLWCQALHPGAWQSSLCQPATACYPTYQPIWLSGPQHPVTCHTVSGTWQLVVAKLVLEFLKRVILIRLIFHDVFILKWRGSIKSF